MIRFSELHPGLGLLRWTQEYEDFKVTASMAEILTQLGIVDEGVYFATLLGYINLSDSVNHPLYDGNNRPYTAYLVGYERLEELERWLKSPADKLPSRVKITLLFILGFQHEATFQYISNQRINGKIPWKIYMGKNQIWLDTRDAIIQNVIQEHWAIHNFQYKAVLMDMLSILRALYVKKSYTAIRQVVNGYHYVVRSRS